MEPIEKIENRFKADFENINIWVHKLEIERIRDVLNDVFLEKTPYTGIWHTIVVNGLPASKDLVGGLYLIFKNQNQRSTSAISVHATVTVRAGGDTEAADSFCKLVQYFFGWIENYVKENHVTDENGELFHMPDFLYSKDYFRFAFPE